MDNPIFLYPLSSFSYTYIYIIYVYKFIQSWLIKYLFFLNRKWKSSTQSSTWRTATSCRRMRGWGRKLRFSTRRIKPSSMSSSSASPPPPPPEIPSPISLCLAPPPPPPPRSARNPRNESFCVLVIIISNVQEIYSF